MMPTATGALCKHMFKSLVTNNSTGKGLRPVVALKTAARYLFSCKEKGFYFGKKDLKIILKPGNTHN